MQVNSTYSLYSLYSNSFDNKKEANATISTIQENNKKSIKDNQNAKEKLYAFMNEYSNINKLDLSLIIGNDALTGASIDYYENLKNQSKNSPIPSQEEFQTDLEFLFGQIEDILMQGFNQNKDSKEFQNLLGSFMMSNRAFSKQSYEDSTQDALQALSQLKNGNQPKDFKKIISDYMTNSHGFSSAIAYFFVNAEYFNQIPQNQKNTIQNALENVQAYLLNQAGELNNESFRLGDAIISWNGDELFFEDYYIRDVKITFVENNSFSSHFSNFDSTQSFFDILEKRDKLEKENQDLKNKQAIEAYNYSNGYSSTLNSKSSKEIDSFLNQMIKELKA